MSRKKKQDRMVILAPTYKTATDEEIAEFLDNPDRDGTDSEQDGLTRFYNSLRYPDSTTEIEQK